MQRLEEGILAALSTFSPSSCYVWTVPLWRLECHGAGKLEASMAHVGGC